MPRTLPKYIVCDTEIYASVFSFILLTSNLIQSRFDDNDEEDKDDDKEKKQPKHTCGWYF